MDAVKEEIVRLPPRSISLKGELFSSTFTYGVTSVIRLGSSLVLTRLLNPEAYGVFAILISFQFMIELMSDVGSTAFLIRHPRGNESKFVHSVWTVRLMRCSLNFCLVFFGAPIIANIYQTPLLTNAFRLLSIWFLLLGAESMSFVLAQRDQRARISNYTDMISNAVMTLFVIALASVIKNHYVLIYGMLLQRALVTIASYFFYRNIGVGIAFDREAVVEQFRFARFVLPSSLLTIVLSQYDKVVLLKLFNLSFLGVYGIAQNMLGPVTGVTMHNARVVLYARCSHYFRGDRTTARLRYYAENRGLFLVGVLLPAIVAGFSQSIVGILYDARYEMVAPILMILGLGAMVTALQHASENFLVASGRTYVVLMANLIRLICIVPATFLGYYLFGFYGFLWFNLIATAGVLLYFFEQQRRCDLLSMRNELALLGAGLSVFLVSLATSHLLLASIPPSWWHLGLKRHS